MSNSITEKVLLQAIVAAIITWITGFCSITDKPIAQISSPFINSASQFTTYIQHRTATLKWITPSDDHASYQVLRHREGFEIESKMIAHIHPDHSTKQQNEIVFTDQVNSYGAYRYEVVKLTGQSKDVIANQLVLFRQESIQ